LQVGRCASFNGKGEKLILPPLDFSPLERGFSISFWWKIEAPSAFGPTAFDFSNGLVDNMYWMDMGSNKASFGIGDGGNYPEVYLPDGCIENTWVHITIVVERTGSTSIWKVYKNGMLAAAKENAYYPSRKLNDNCIGRSNYPDDYFSLKGKIDSFGLFMEPLLPVQAVILYQSTGIRASAKSSHLCITSINICQVFSHVHP
jgi:hypothetical protein